jgi:hypothetical protein
MQNLSLLTSNLSQLKGLVTGDFNRHLHLRIFLVGMLGLSILIQLITKTLVFMIVSNKSQSFRGAIQFLESSASSVEICVSLEWSFGREICCFRGSQTRHSCDY